MNRLQRLRVRRSYFVSLNRDDMHPASIIDATRLTHPVYTRGRMAAQNHLPRFNGRRKTCFCGSYFGYGFHEDTFRSAVAVAAALGVPFPDATPSPPEAA